MGEEQGEGQSYLSDGSVGHLRCGQLPVGHRHSGKTCPQGLVLRVDETLRSLVFWATLLFFMLDESAYSINIPLINFS